MNSFFRLIRLPNILIIVFTQVLSGICLYPLGLALLQDLHFWIIILSTAFTAAAGYIINDYLDVNIDEINKPDKVVIGTSIKRKHAILIHISISVIAVLGMAIVSYKLAVLVLVIGLLLIKYSSTFKKQVLVGNIFVSLFCSMTIFILYLWNSNILLNHVIAYSVFAFITTLNREIIKDTEDIKGDRMQHCKTFPVVYGINKTKNLLYILNSVILTASIIYFYQLFERHDYYYNKMDYIAFVYALIFIIAPMFYMIFKLILARKVDEFGYLSKLNKLIMLSGILSLLFLIL